jgi:hypothetical protein
MSRVSNNNSIANSARTSPRIDPTTSNQVANRAPLNFNVQKRNDADTVSVFSQAINSIRETKGKSLLTVKKTDFNSPIQSSQH